MAENYVSTNMETGVQVREALTKIESYQPDLFAWTEIGDSVTVNLKSPTAYSGITDPGDYVIYKFSNGPSKIPSTLSPILLSLRDGKKYVSANGSIYTLNSAGDSWVSIDEVVDDDTILYVKSDIAPTRTNNTFWFDTSHYDGTSDGYIDLKYYDTNSSSWISVFNGDNYLKKSVLDPDGKNTDIYTYITEKVADVVGDYGEFIKHKANQLTLIHITADERTQYAKIISESELRTLINDTYKPAIKQTVDESVSTELDTTQISADSTTLDNSYKAHLANHITADNIASWKNKADADHIHDYTTGDTKLQASQIVSGTFGADQLPDEIKERYYEITTSPAAEFGNTSITDAQRKAKYHNGNAFYYETIDENTGENVRKWYRIIDSTKVGTSSWTDGVIDFTGKEAKMDWSNITGRPTTLEEFGITTDLYTKTQVDEKFNPITTQLESMNEVLADCEGDTGYRYGYKLNWTVTKMPITKLWHSVCFAIGKFVAVAQSSKIVAYSTDGINWTEATISSTARHWWSICYGNNKFVAVTVDSNSYFAYSTDGINWTESTISSTSRSWPSVCYGNGKFVTISGRNVNSNVFAYSTDGINWTENTISSTSRRWNCICYGNDKFVAVANNTNIFAYSTDGINWTESTLPISINCQSICYGNGLFIIGISRSTYYLYSTDGINWTKSNIMGNNNSSWTIIYSNKKYIAIDDNGGASYSIDGMNWIYEKFDTSGVSRSYWAVCYGNGKYITIDYLNKALAYAYDTLPLSIDKIGIQYKTKELSEFDDTMTGTIPQLDCIIKTTDNKIFKTTYNLNSTYIKPDGTLYTTTDSKEPLGATMMEIVVNEIPEVVENNISENNRNWACICYGNEMFVTFATGTREYAYSTDGINWTLSRLPGTGYWTTACYGNGMFIVMQGMDSVYMYSTDGINWTREDAYYSQQINCVCYGNGKFVAVAGEETFFAYSTDGINWDYSNDVTSRNWSSVCYGKDKYIALAYNTNYFAYSTDGITWTESTISGNSSRLWHSACYGKDKFIIVSRKNGYFAYSMDGINWTEKLVDNDTSLKWEDTCYENGLYVIATLHSNTYAYSTDGINWTKVVYGTEKEGHICCHNGIIVVV